MLDATHPRRGQNNCCVKSINLYDSCAKSTTWYSDCRTQHDGLHQEAEATRSKDDHQPAGVRIPTGEKFLGE